MIQVGPCTRRCLSLALTATPSTLHQTTLCLWAGYPGEQCQVCYDSWSVFEKPLHDNSSAVMALNRGDVAINVTITLMDLGLALDDWPRHSWSTRDVWARSDLGVFSDTMTHRGEVQGLTVAVPAHGVRLLRMVPMS